MRLKILPVLLGCFTLATAPAQTLEHTQQFASSDYSLCNARDWPIASLDAMSQRYMRSTVDANPISGPVPTTYAVEVWRQTLSGGEVQVCRADTVMDQACSKRYWEFTRVNESWKFVRSGVDVKGPELC